MSTLHVITNSFKNDCFSGVHDLVNDDIKVALYSDSSSLDETKQNYGTLGELSTTGYTPGGLSLSLKAVSSENGTVIFDCDDVSWPSLEDATIRGLLIYNATKSNKSIYCIQTPPMTAKGSFGLKMPIPNEIFGLLRIMGYNRTPLNDGYLYVWGNNNDGALGLGDSLIRTTPNKVGNENIWLDNDGDASNSISIKLDGSLWTCGDNSFGQLGNGESGSSFNKEERILIDTVNQYKKCSMRGSSSAAIRSDGILHTWGNDGSGRLGQGTSGVNLDTPTPVDANNYTDIEISRSGFMHAIRKTGTNEELYGWGNNTFGFIGDGTFTQRNSPVKIGSKTNWKKLCRNPDQHMGAIDDNGDLYMWGLNDDYQLGDGTNTLRENPVFSLSNVLNASCFDFGSIAVKTDGTMWSVGDNTYGQLGLGDSIDRTTWTQIGVDNDWIKVISGGTFALAIKSDGTIYSWGRDIIGQLGQGSGTSLDVPTQIGTDTDWLNIFVGYDNAFCIKES